MTKIYHLALVTDWQDAVNSGKTYYPPTYEQDGFTHGTAEAPRLIEVANHFYTGSVGDWVCLEMSQETLATTNVEVKFEPAAAVGLQDGKLEATPDEDAPLFPHLYGGIDPKAVIATYGVTRDSKGHFISIELDSPLA